MPAGEELGTILAADEVPAADERTPPRAALNIAPPSAKIAVL
jgi:hypothetical protein